MKETEAKNELEFIKNVMEDSRKIIVDDGKNFIFWGIIAALGLITTYILIVEKFGEYIKWVWVVLIAIGWIYTITIHLKKEKKRRVRTFAGKILSVTWFSCGLTMTIIGIGGSFSGAISGVYIFPTISIVTGIAFAITGTVYNDKWFALLSAGWWLGGIVMFFYPGIHSILMMALMIIFFQITPGIVLYNRYKKELLIQS